MIGFRDLRSPRWRVLSFAGGLLFASAAALAHTGFDSPVFARLFAAAPGAPDAGSLVFEIRNNAKTALTLTRVTAPGEEALVIERRRWVFGVEVWQPVRFIRLDPGETLALGPPDYRLRASKQGYADLSAPGGGVRARFSPLGEVVALFEQPGGAFAPDGAAQDASPPLSQTNE